MRNYYSYIKTSDAYFDETTHATYKGITIKTFILLAITIAVSITTAVFLPTILANNLDKFIIALVAASIIGVISVMIGRMDDNAAKVCGVLYSACEGLVLGTVTCIVNLVYPGAGAMAISATLVIFTIMLILYSFGFIRDGSKLRMITFGILFSLVGLVLFDFIYVLCTGMESYTIILLIQAALLFYGVITLTYNFSEAEMVVKLGASKNAEWSVALGLTVSLIYIYIEIIRIVLIVADRR